MNSCPPSFGGTLALGRGRKRTCPIGSWHSLLLRATIEIARGADFCRSFEVSSESHLFRKSDLWMLRVGPLRGSDKVDGTRPSTLSGPVLSGKRVFHPESDSTSAPIKCPWSCPVIRKRLAGFLQIALSKAPRQKAACVSAGVFWLGTSDRVLPFNIRNHPMVRGSECRRLTRNRRTGVKRQTFS